MQELGCANYDGFAMSIIQATCKMTARSIPHCEVDCTGVNYTRTIAQIPSKAPSPPWPPAAVPPAAVPVSGDAWTTSQPNRSAPTSSVSRILVFVALTATAIGFMCFAIRKKQKYRKMADGDDDAECEDFGDCHSENERAGAGEQSRLAEALE